MQAANIPGLFNTGVDNQGVPLKDNDAELHWKLVDPSPLVVVPVVTTSAGGFPIGPWLADNNLSAWLTPAADANGPGLMDGSANYYFELSFDLTGYLPETARITGSWCSDNTGKDILINGVSTGQTNPNQFGAFTPFSITSGFVEGTNTITFVVNNGGGEADGTGPVGVRVELSGTAMAPGTPPTVTKQPTSQVAPVGDTVVLGVEVEGSEPISYQWRLNGNNLAGFTNRTTEVPGLSNLTTNQSGQYDVVVSSPYGTTNSVPVIVTVLPNRIPGLFSTGVDASGAVLSDLSVDPHYQLVTNADSTSTEALVHDTTVFPIVAGPWVMPNTSSAWIAPRGDTVAAASGVYVYKTTFDLTGLNPKTAVILGNWGADNDGMTMATDILLNGVPMGIKIAPFNTLTPFLVTNTASANFFAGVNTLEFRVQNDGAGYTGLRVENLRGGAYPGQAQSEFKLALGFYNGLQVGGFVGRTYQIEYQAPKDTNWVTLTNLVLPSDPYFFVDPASATNPGRTYRATLMP